MKCLKNFRLFSVLFVFVLLVASCTKDDTITPETNEGEVNPPLVTKESNQLLQRSTSVSEDGLELDCITINYAFDLATVDGSTITISSDEDWNTLFLDSTQEETVIDFVYPLTVTAEDGSTSEVSDGEALAEAFASCLPNGWNEDQFPAFLIDIENSCYTLAYPVSLTNDAGDVVVANDDAEFAAALANEQLYFVFPLDLVDEDGEAVTVSTVDDLLITLVSCNDVIIDTTSWDGGFEQLGCYLLQFPFDLELEDGTIVTVADHMQYCDLLLQGTVGQFVFPLTLEDFDGNIFVANSEDELNELLVDCDFTVGGPTTGIEIPLLYFASVDSAGFETCIEVIYPLTVEEFDQDGNSLGIQEFANTEEHEAALFSGAIYQVQYPLSIVWVETGETIEFNNEEELISLLFSCGG